MYLKFVIVVFSSLVFYSTLFNGEESILFNNIEDKENWFIDSLGCLGLRGELTPFLIYKLESSKISRRVVDKELGQPNYRYSNNNGYVYYIYSDCKYDSLYKNWVTSLSIYFDSDTVSFVGGSIK